MTNLKSDLKFALVFIIILLCKAVSAQDSHFSHIYTSTIQINPANTSLCKADWQLTNIYRNQWKNINVPFKTFMISGEKQFYALNQNFGGGLTVIHEKSGVLKYSITEILLSGSIHKSFNQHSFHFGIQSGFVNRSLNTEDLTLPDQYDNTIGYFNNSVNSDDNISNNNSSNFIFNTGVIWKVSNQVINPSIGFSIYNFNNPKYTYTDKSGNKIISRKAIHTNVEMNLGRRISIDVLLLYMNQNRASQIMTGSVLKYHYNAEDEIRTNNVYLGTFIRNGFNRTFDALIFTAGIELKNVMVSLAYDRSVSKIKYLNNNSGAFEIMLKYKGIYTNMNKGKRKCASF